MKGILSSMMSFIRIGWIAFPLEGCRARCGSDFFEGNFLLWRMRGNVCRTARGSDKTYSPRCLSRSKLRW